MVFTQILKFQKCIFNHPKLSTNKIPLSLATHYNKRCPCTPSDFIGFWVNSLVVMNGDQWKNNEFTALMNED